MKKYVGLFVGIFMLSACCAAPVRQQVDLRGEDYHVSIRSYPRHHTHHKRVIVPFRPRHPKHVPHAPKPPRHHSPWRG